MPTAAPSAFLQSSRSPAPSSYCLLRVVILCVCAFFPTIAGAELPPAAQRQIDFVKDVQPIFAASCIKCHGPLQQEGNYRLDARESALTGGDSYAPNIRPHKSAASPLIQFVAGEVDDMQMPAKGAKLSAEQIGILRAWIDQGAEWPASASVKAEDKLAWWSLQPLKLPAIPAKLTHQHPIDAFIQAKLDQHQLHPAPPAERQVLVRRLYYDLIGLPPTPEEIDRFVASTDPAAYEKLVERLLASPRYGERWARHWMDTAHFAETHGHDQDRIRENAWPYRDYLIAAFNQDKPYSQFVREQVAGDVVAPDEPRAITALGFLAAGPWDESSLRDIREDTLDRQIGRYLDRDDMLTNVMSNITSLTVQCARCHDHKFDPISQADYYALQAVFAGVERANRSFDADPAVQARRLTLQRRQKQLATPDATVRAELLSAESQEAVARWEREAADRHVAWKVLDVDSASTTDGSKLAKQDDGSFLATGPRPERDTYEFSSGSPLPEIAGLRLEVLTHDSLPHLGPGRQDNGNLHLSEIEISVTDGATTTVSIAKAVADFDQDQWGIARAIDGQAPTAWGIYPQVGVAHQAVFVFSTPQTLPPSAKLTIKLKQLHGGGHLIGRARLAVTANKNPLGLAPLPPEIATTLAKAAPQRSAEERYALALFVERTKVSEQLAALPKQSYVYAAAADFEPDGGLKPPAAPRIIHRLQRGDIRNPKEELAPGALSCIKTLPARFTLPATHQESTRRAALADWLVHRDNPLTWRSIVNRIWMHHFGRGIVATPNDFGRLGAQPSHPELLDWLAVSFRDSGQSIKDLHRFIVTSETYRQSSQAGQCLVDGERSARLDNAATKDADNQLLWRMQRSRLDAECVRDAMLAMSGRLDLRMGGPSDRQFDLKPGKHVTPIIDYGGFDLDSSQGQRRSIYRFLFRTLPDPFMEALDCPAGDQIMPTRTNSVTVQQALAMWNDAFVVRQAEHLAVRLHTAAATTEAQVDLAYRLAFGRAATAAERARFVAYADKHGLANFCRLMFNLNEFVFVD